MRTLGHRKGLLVRLGYEFGRTHIRDPNLNWAQPLLAQTLAMCLNFVSGRFGLRSRAHLAFASGYM